MKLWKKCPFCGTTIHGLDELMLEAGMKQHWTRCKGFREKAPLIVWIRLYKQGLNVMTSQIVKHDARFPSTNKDKQRTLDEV